MRISIPIFTFETSLILISIVLLGCSDNEKVSPEKKAAVNSALHWVALIDSGRYEESWQVAFASFKEDVTQRQWRIGLEQIREPYGMVMSRKIKETKNLASKQSRSPQKNLVVEFTTQFENQQVATEFVTVLLDNDGRWRVSAYYLDR